MSLEASQAEFSTNSLISKSSATSTKTPNFYNQNPPPKTQKTRRMAYTGSPSCWLGWRCVCLSRKPPHRAIVVRASRRTLHIHRMPSHRSEFKGTKYENPVYGWHRVPSTAHIRRLCGKLTWKVPYGHNLASMTVGWGSEYGGSVPYSNSKPTVMPYEFTDRKLLFFV